MTARRALMAHLPFLPVAAVVTGATLGGTATTAWALAPRHPAAADEALVALTIAKDGDRITAKEWNALITAVQQLQRFRTATLTATPTRTATPRPAATATPTATPSRGGGGRPR